MRFELQRRDAVLIAEKRAKYPADMAAWGCLRDIGVLADSVPGRM